MKFQITVPTRARADALFSNMPPEVCALLASGFAQLATLSPEALKNIASQVTRWLDPAEPEPRTEILAHQYKLGVSTMNAIVAAVTFQASALFAANCSLEAFVAKATETGVLKEEYVSAVRVFGEKHLGSHSTALNESLVRANVSTRILPSFHSLSTTIDIRVATVKDKHAVTIPVAIAELLTDVDDEKLIFQLTRRDVDQLMEQLGKVTKLLARSKDMTIQPTPKE